MKLVDYELKHSYKATADTVGKETDAGNAALDWSRLYEGVSNSDGQTKVSQIESDAKSYYENFSKVSSDPTLSGAADTADIGMNNSANNCSASSADAGSTEDGTGTHKKDQIFIWSPHSLVIINSSYFLR